MYFESVSEQELNCFNKFMQIEDSVLKGKWQQKFLLSHLKETLKIIYRSLLQNFCIYFTFGDIVT